MTLKSDRGCRCQCRFHLFAEEGFNDFAVDMSYMPAIKKRVNLARRIEKHLHEKRKNKSDADWFKRAAKDMDIDVDEVCGVAPY